MKTIAAIFFCIMVMPNSATAKPFEVVSVINGCKYFIVEQGLDYILVEDWLCFKPRKGDSGSGDLNGYGIKKVNLSGTSCDLYVEDYMLTKSRASEKLIDKCD